MSLHQKMLEEDWDGWGGVLNKPGFDQAQNKAMSVGPAVVVRTERIPPLLADSSQRKTGWDGVLNKPGFDQAQDKALSLSWTCRRC